jgi:hypothetical protein
VTRALVTVAVMFTTAAAAPAAKSSTAPTPEAVGNRQIVGILDVRAEGLASDVAAQFEKQLELQIDTKRFYLATRARMRQAMTSSTRWAEGCVIGTCLRDVKAQTGAGIVVLAALSGSGTSFGYVVTLVRTDTGRVLAQESGRCDVCVITEAMNQGAATIVRLLREVPQVLTDEDQVKAAQFDLAAAPLRARVDKLEDADRHHRHLGIALTVVGLIAAGVGVAVYATTDHDAGLATTAGGAGLAASGLVVLAF